jgi:EAL domain-containing protein (putative c-di-GMP-specific phosphodiesterase class I)
MIEERNGEGVTDVLRRLRALGISLSIDDFGTGFSSMSRLQQLSVQELKIDRSFIQDIARSEKDREIAASIIELSHRLGISVTAEGVEDEPTAAILTALGCDHLQGYLFARAMPVEAFVTWLEQPQG